MNQLDLFAESNAHSNPLTDQAQTVAEALENGGNHYTTDTQKSLETSPLDPWMVKTLNRIKDGAEHDRPPLTWVKARKMERMGLLTVYQFRNRWMGGLTITEKGREALRASRDTRGAASLGEPEHKTSGFSKGDPVTVAGRPYRFHRDCGAFVWLAALDAGVSGPFYWHRAEEVDRA